MPLRRDSALTRRILVTLALVVAVDAAFVGVLVLLVRPLAAPLLAAARAAAGLPPVAEPLAWVLAGTVALAACLWAQVRYTRRETLASVDATPVEGDDYPDLQARVTRLASLADVAPPDLAVAESDVPNSFAVGGVGSSTLVVSEGLLAELDGDELDAVLAHELAHVKNRDAAVMTLASFLPALTSDRYSLLEAVGGEYATSRAVWLAALVGAYLLGAVALGTVPFAPGYAAVFVAGAALAVLLGGVALGVLATPVVFLARRLSRYREFVADRGAGRLTGDPAALAAALRRLDPDAERRPDVDGRAREDVAALCLLPHGFDPGAGDGADGEGDGGGDDVFHVETHSHPPTAARVERLRDLAAELEAPLRDGENPR